MRRLAIWFFTAAVLAVFLWPAAVLAQPVCGPRADFLRHLQDKYGERPVGIGLTGGGGVLELLVEPGGKSWTIFVTTPGGVSCVVAAGQAWEALTDNPAVEEGA